MQHYVQSLADSAMQCANPGLGETLATRSRVSTCAEGIALTEAELEKKASVVAGHSPVFLLISTI